MRTKANEDKLNGEDFWENFNQDQLKFKFLGFSPGGSKVLFDVLKSPSLKSPTVSNILNSWDFLPVALHCSPAEGGFSEAAWVAEAAAHCGQ